MDLAMRVARKLRRKIGRLGWNLGGGSGGIGPFRSIEPVSRDFGYGRGTPIDRIYIERFLAEHSGDIKGTTLEVGDDAYTARFGGAAAVRREVIHIDASAPAATYRGDMTQPGVLPSERFDCAVITQTLQLIYDLAAAVRALRQSLVPGGTLLVTVPGISPVAADRWGERWLWSLTPLALARLLGDEFGAANVRTRSYGNALAATAFLQGIAAEDVQRRLLEPNDPLYPVIVAAAATRACENPGERRSSTAAG